MTKFKIGDKVMIQSQTDEILLVDKVVSVDTGSLKFENYTLSDGRVVGVSELRRWDHKVDLDGGYSG